MATNQSAIAALYSDINADLVPYYENSVLLPNPGLIAVMFNIAAGAGNTVKVPTQDAFSAGATIAEGASILSGAARDMATTGVSLSVSKRAAGTVVTSEALEDGGVSMVSGNVVSQLSRAIAQATDVAGFNFMSSGAEAVVASGDVDVTTLGATVTATETEEVALVWSPESMAYASKRDPMVKLFENIDNDQTEITATVRNGFARLRTEFIRGITSNGDIESAEKATLAHFSQAVAGLRGSNAPADAAGFYMAAISPTQEYHLATALNSVTSGSVGDLSMIGNAALVSGLIGQAVGLRFVRSNNLPSYVK